jgi:FixJ family two-component response regulator
MGDSLAPARLAPRQKELPAREWRSKEKGTPSSKGSGASALAPIRCLDKAMSATAATPVAIIDDDESLCRSLSRLLRLAGFHPVIFLSAEDFLVVPLRPSFRCLLIDIQLEGMSGIALRRRLLSEGDHTPVLYITAHDDPAARTEAMSSGCAGFFRKTDPGGAIIEALRRVTAPASP